MSIFDKGKDFADKHDEQVDQGIEKAGDQVDQRFEGHEGQVDKAQDLLQQKTGDGDSQQGGQQDQGQQEGQQ